MGDGYVRQSSADIVAGNTVEAGPLNAEFNQIQAAFHLSSGHSHDGTTGEGPKIGLTTSVSGVLPVANGGYAGIHKVNGATAPTANDDTGDGYAVGSVWIDTTNDRVYVAVDVTLAAAVWVYIGNTTGWQPLDGELTALAGLTSAADKLPYFTGSGTAALADLSAFGRSIIDDASEAAFKATVNLEIGTDVQAWDAHLDDLAGISPAQGDIIYFNGTDWVALTAGTSGHFLKTNGAGANPAWTANVGISDGDKGDITVSGSGATWTIDDNTVGTDELQDSFAVTTDITIPNTGLHILDTNSTHDLIIVPGSNLTADRNFTITTGDAARTLTLNGNPTLDDWFDQSVKTTASPTFANPTITSLEWAGGTDATLTRSGAGNLSIEGNVIYRAGGTDVPVTDGGTGSSTAAGAATNLGLGTGDSPQFTGINVGHASDTTITRNSAGIIDVEGVPLYSQIPQNSQSAAYTLVLTDAQKHIYHPTSDNNARTFTIPANSSVAYPIGTCLTFINDINTVTIAINTDTMVLAGAGTTGSRTLAAQGVATAVKITSTRWIISGTGLT